MMRHILFAGAALMLPATAQAAEMSLATFLAKADALESKGILAMGSPDIAIVKGEMQRVGKAYRADLAAQKLARKPAHSCPPEKITMTSTEIMTELRKVPAPARPKTTVRTAFYDMMKRRYPCR
jgi:hypothetical protein